MATTNPWVNFLLRVSESDIRENHPLMNSNVTDHLKLGEIVGLIREEKTFELQREAAEQFVVAFERDGVTLDSFIQQHPAFEPYAPTTGQALSEAEIGRIHLSDAILEFILAVDRADIKANDSAIPEDMRAVVGQGLAILENVQGQPHAHLTDLKKRYELQPFTDDISGKMLDSLGEEGMSDMQNRYAQALVSIVAGLVQIEHAQLVGVEGRHRAISSISDPILTVVLYNDTVDDDSKRIYGGSNIIVANNFVPNLIESCAQFIDQKRKETPDISNDDIRADVLEFIDQQVEKAFHPKERDESTLNELDYIGVINQVSRAEQLAVASL